MNHASFALIESEIANLRALTETLESTQFRQVVQAIAKVESLFDCYSAPLTLVNVLVRDIAQANWARSEAIIAVPSA